MNTNGWLRRLTGAMLVTLLSVSGCDDDGTVAPPEQLPGLEFSFAGDRSGTYQSDGRLPTIAADGLPEFGSWAVARPDSLGGLVIAGFDGEVGGFGPLDNGLGDVFILQLDDIREGTFEPCGIFANGGCHGRFFVGVVLADLATVQDAFEITDGSVEIVEASASRIRGSFDATFTSADGTRTITVVDGVIDVPFSNNLSVANGVACLARNLVEGTNESC